MSVKGNFKRCQTCTARSVGCHSACRIYLEEKELYEKRKKQHQLDCTPIMTTKSFYGDSGFTKFRRRSKGR